MSASSSIADVERKVVEIWAAVLGRERIRAEDDFFRLGGNSLAAVQIAARASAAFGRDVPLDAVFQGRTAAGFAAIASAAEASSARGRRRARRRSDKPSPLEEGAWVTRFYNSGVSVVAGDAYLLQGPLDVGALEWALSELVRRHETLRTTFPVAEHRPRVQVLPPGRFELPLTDVPKRSQRDREAAIRSAIEETLSEPFAYWDEPPFRARLLRAAPQSHVLILVAHEIVCDGEGFVVLVRELSELYDACVAGRSSPLPEPAPQYRDVFEARISAEGRAYWSEVLAEAPLTTCIAYETGGLVGSNGRVEASVRLPASASGRMEALAHDEAATSFMVYLAAFCALLRMHSGDTRVLVEAPAANRTRVEREGVIGYFARVLPLAVEVGDEASFRGLVQHVREVSLTAFRHADSFPGFEPHLAISGVRGLRKALPKFRALDDDSRPAPVLAGLRVQRIGPMRGEGGHLELRMVESAEAPTSAIVSSSVSEVGREALAAMGDHYRRIVEAAGSDPDRPLAEILPSQAPRRRRPGVRDTTEEAPSLHELVTRTARHTPDAVALRSPETALTYGVLDERAERLAHGLRSLGVVHGTRVGVRFDPSADLLVALVGTVKAGASCVPLDPTASTAPLLDLLLVAEASHAEREEASGARVLDLARVVANATASDPRPRAAGDEGGSLVVCTAGVTGPPREVLLSQRVLVRQATWLRRLHQITREDCGFHAPGPGARSWALAPWPYLAAGATIAVGDGSWLEGVTVAALPPRVAARELAHASRDPAFRLLRVQGHGAFAPPASGRHARVRVVREYVVAEAGGAAIAEALSGATAASQPVSGVEASVEPGVRVLAAHGGDALPGIAGELCIDHDGTAVPTGDIGRWRVHGGVDFLGRRQDEVRFRGYRLTPLVHELEEVLSTHPALERAAAVWHAETASLVAQVVPRDAGAPDPADLDRWVRDRVSDWVLPARYVAVDGLPERADGSVDSRVLDKTAVRGTTLVRRGMLQHREAQQLLQIWRRLLGNRRLELHDNFFAAGGDALLGVEMASRARDAGIPVDVALLPLAPSVDDLLTLMEMSEPL